MTGVPKVFIRDASKTLRQPLGTKKFPFLTTLSYTLNPHALRGTMNVKGIIRLRSRCWTSICRLMQRYQ